jgi:hypothetical protein
MRISWSVSETFFDQAPAVFNKHKQSIEGLWSKRHRQAVAQQQVLSGIDTKRPELPFSHRPFATYKLSGISQSVAGSPAE